MRERKNSKSIKVTEKHDQDEDIKIAVSQELQQYITQKIIACEISLKLFIESKMKLNSDSIHLKIENCIDEKYRKLHDRSGYKNKNKVNLTKEDVLIVIESVITEDNIQENIDRYMEELSDLRLLIILNIMIYFNRTLIINGKTPCRAATTTIKDAPKQNSKKFYCGWFLKWFYPLNFRYTLKHIKEVFLPSIFPDISKEVGTAGKGSNIPINKPTDKLAEAKKFAKSSRRRWLNFFESLWNHPTIEDLIDQSFPSNTEVDGEKDGLGFITETIAENIFNKVFYGVSFIPPIISKGDDNTEHLELSLKLFTVEG